MPVTRAVKTDSVKRAVKKAGVKPADGMKKSNDDTEKVQIGGGENVARTPGASYVPASPGTRVCLLMPLVVFLLSTL